MLEFRNDGSGGGAIAHEQAGARVGEEVLRVGGEAREQEQRRAASGEGERRERAVGVAGAVDGGRREEANGLGL